MGVSDRDPLFFPPAKYSDQEEPEHPLEVDTKAQEKSLRIMLLVGAILAVVVLLAMRSCPLGAPSSSQWRPVSSAGQDR